MDMDDPWGDSPWAEEEPVHPEVESKPDEQLSRPTTPVRATTIALEEKTNSPWDDADDGGFGDWAPISEGNGGALGFDGAADWEEDVPTGTKENLSADMPWGNSTSVASKDIPKLSPSLLPKFAEVVRQPSPDPWATGFVEDEDEDTRPYGTEEENTVTQERATSTEIINVPEEDAEIQLPEVNTVVDSEVQEDGIPAPLLPEEQSLADTITSNEIPESNGAENVSTNIKLSESSSIVAEPVGESSTPNIQVISRPSSSPSEHSHHEETLPDSPRTSIEEEPKRAWVTRKVSTKVQGLVQHFDSLATPGEIPHSAAVSLEDTPRVEIPVAAADDELNISEEGSQSEDDDFRDFGDFGDFEEGNSDIEEQVSEIPETSTGGNSKATDHQDEATVPIKDLGPVTFDLNLDVLNELYSNNDISPSTETVFIPDRDLDNTLSSTSQRKTWYRISRYGTKRKHDTGDDENYARVTWTASQMRQDTLKIVARWMEEDRISGRVVLGGVSKGSSVFGWSDVKAGPVPIEQAFAAKRGKRPDHSIPAPPSEVEVPREWPKGLVRSRSSSKGRSVSKPRRQNSVKSMSISEGVPVPAALTETPAADFGWNSSTKPEQKVPVDVNKTSRIQSTARTTRSSHRSTSSTSSLQAHTHKTLPPVIIPTAAPLPASRPHIPNPIITQLKVEEVDDDDWGEMIASPVVGLAPVLPLPISLKKEQDDEWGEMVASPIFGVAPVLPLPIPAKNEHPKTPSFDDILPPTSSVPQSPISQINTLPQSRTFDTPISQTAIPQSQAFSVFDRPISQAVIAPSTQLPSRTPTNGPPTSTTLTTIAPISPAPFSAPSTTVNNSPLDPWASADFSFFDSPAPAPAPPLAKLTTKLPPKPAPPSRTIPASAKTVKFSTPAPIPKSSPPPRTSTNTSTYKTIDELAQDAIVQGMISDLPDLGYMFRR